MCATTTNTSLPLVFYFCSCRGKFKSERDDCDLNDGSNDVLVLGFEPATISYAGLAKIRKQRTTFNAQGLLTAAKSRVLPKSPQVSLKINRGVSPKTYLPSSSSVTSTTEAMAANMTKVKFSSPASSTDSDEEMESSAAPKSLTWSKNPPSYLRSTRASLMKSQSKSSSVAPITKTTAAAEIQTPFSSIVRMAENDSNVIRKNEKKTTEENDVVQLLVKGVWVLRRLAANVCEVTFVNRLEDTGDIPKKIFNMKVSR